MHSVLERIAQSEAEFDFIKDTCLQINITSSSKIEAMIVYR